MKQAAVTFLLIVHFCSLLLLAGGAGMETFINYPNWFYDIPTSLENVRRFMAVHNPGEFFQTLAPLIILSGLLFVALGWKHRTARNLVLASVLLMISVEVLTFNLVYPRLRMMVREGATLHSVESLKQAAAEFLRLNTFRMCGMAVCCALSVAGAFRYLRETSPDAMRAPVK